MKVTFEKLDESVHSPNHYKLAQTESLAQYIERLTYRLNVEHLIIHDVKSCDRYFCDQGCEVGHGCKKYYTPDNHSLIILATVIKVPSNYGEVIADEEANEYQLEILSRLRVKYPNLDINVGRGDRLVVKDGNKLRLIKGVLFYDVRNQKNYDGDEIALSDEIKSQIIDRHLWV